MSRIRTNKVQDSAITSAKIAASTIAASDISTGGVGAANLTTNLKKGYIHLPLGSARLISSNAIPAIAVASGNGGNLASDTDPKLERVNGATDKKLRIDFAASSSAEIQWDFVYPPDLDDTATLTVNILAKMAGATDTPVLTVGYFENVGDTNAGGNTAALSTTLAQKSVTIAAADVGAYPAAASVVLTVGAHTTDAAFVYGVWIEYTRKD